ncbi:FkbM family methyltransferase [Sinorhizobium sp. M4_45]|uniref:FkbM family methyltransferase n=1 Tax=Sinorhizobium sp. M4_45 TaxID=2037901 RepID=UPI000C997EF2|nr:FkbM family methyltransferase [Sinorhizobium sp. M4_45]PND24968.1 methyltransferase FkbM [Sinorhizobium sp. M4_45]
MSRPDSAIASRTALLDDFFGGWEPSDKELFASFYRDCEGTPGMITDFMGIKARTEYHPWAAHMDGWVIKDLPIPDDALRAEAIEYFVLFDAINNSRDTFRMAEIGASYAPWSCAAYINATRRGLTPHITAVEASQTLYDLIPQHMSDNGVDPTMVRTIKAAVASQRGTLHFPKVTDYGQNGGQVVEGEPEVDYVGRAVEYEEVTAITLTDVIKDDVFDLLHVDIQGVEAAVLASAIELLSSKVRRVFVGTHSRLIEGRLLELFAANGWALVRERPTKFQYFADRPDITGWTSRDGGQYWINNKLL